MNNRQIIKEYGDTNSFYVLHYDTKTTKYHNRIVFKTYKEAKKEFDEDNYFWTPTDRIELIFSPEDNSIDNKIMDKKTNPSPIKEELTPDLKTELTNHFCSYLDSCSYAIRKVGDKSYDCLLDVDFELSKDTIIDICDSFDPQERLYDEVSQVAYNGGAIEAEWNWIRQDFKETLEKKGVEVSEEDFDEWFSDYAPDTLYIDYDYSDFENQKVKATLFITNGDHQTDFTDNPSYANNYGADGLDKANSSIVWLAEQLGISYEQLDAALKDPKTKTGNAVLDSIVEECINVTTSMNAVTFIGTTTLGELMKFKEDVTPVKVSKGAWCGLYDAWQGGGSDFSIALDRDLVIPAYNVYDFCIDGGYGYSVENTYGFTSKAFPFGVFEVQERNEN